MELNNLLLFFLLIGFNLFFYKYFLLILYKYNPKFLIDDQFEKPQSFHESAISVAGGLGIFISAFITILNFWLFKNMNFFEYLSICTIFFILGFADDLRINVKPVVRLALMIIFLIFFLEYNNFYIEKTGISFLNQLINNSKIFSLVFACLCFLFIINGANLIDGYNGLLGFHSLIILLNLFFINHINEFNTLANFLFFIIISLIIFLKYNFPKAKVFLGDAGSYFLGAFIALATIKTSILNPSISPFYFCILLFYLFFEVFFSFFRKLIKEKKSPVYPDDKHLHMLLYKFLFKKNNNKLKSNYYVAIVINVVYSILLIPAIFMMDNGLFCKYYSILLFVVYIFSYKITNAKIK